MAAKRLEEIGTFLKWNQILEMSHRRRLSSLIIWRQVFPVSEDGHRSFLVVVGSVSLLLLLLLNIKYLNYLNHLNDNFNFLILGSYSDCGFIRGWRRNSIVIRFLNNLVVLSINFNSFQVG